MSFNEKVYYLENSDFDSQGALVHDTHKPVLVMVYSDSCPHCIHSKPEVNKFAAANPDAVVAVVATQGSCADKALLARLGSFIPGISGIPTFALFRNGRFVKKTEGFHTAEELKQFVHS